MNKNHFINGLMEFLIYTLLSYVMIVCGGLIEGNKMKRQSLEGYHAVAVYETNSVKEVTVKEIKWIK